MPKTIKGITYYKATNSKKYKAVIPAKLWNRAHPDKPIKTQKTVYFGAKGYQHYKDAIGYYSNMDHGDKKRRDNYRSRHAGVKNKSGMPAYKIKYSPSWFSYYYLW